jgi:hypothetical protein
VSKRQDRKLARFYASHGGEKKVTADLKQIGADMERERRERHNKLGRQQSGVLVIKGQEKP